jgi:hypothetical protein
VKDQSDEEDHAQRHQEQEGFDDVQCGCLL